MGIPEEKHKGAGQGHRAIPMLLARNRIYGFRDRELHRGFYRVPLTRSPATTTKPLKPHAPLKLEEAETL